MANPLGVLIQALPDTSTEAKNAFKLALETLTKGITVDVTVRPGKGTKDAISQVQKVQSTMADQANKVEKLGLDKSVKANKDALTQKANDTKKALNEEKVAVEKHQREISNILRTSVKKVNGMLKSESVTTDLGNYITQTKTRVPNKDGTTILTDTRQNLGKQTKEIQDAIKRREEIIATSQKTIAQSMSYGINEETSQQVRDLIDVTEKYGVATDKNVVSLSQEVLQKEKALTRSKQFQTVQLNERKAIATVTAELDRYLATNTKISSNKDKSLYSQFQLLRSKAVGGQLGKEEYRTQLAELKQKTIELGLETETLSSSVKRLFSKHFAVGIAMLGLGAIQQTFSQMLATVKELDKAIVNLQVATGYTYGQASELLVTYTKLGQQIGATTSQVAESGNTWLRQGYSIEDSNKLIVDSMMLSKLGMLESADAAKYLTSAVKGYKLGVDEATGVVDKLTAVDMQSAVDAGGIAEAMASTANGARLAGVEIDKLVGIVSAVGEVTQKDKIFVSLISNNY